VSLARTIPVALTCAGLDPSGGAGVIADVRTFEKLGVFSAAVITCVTYQGPAGVRGRRDLDESVVREQLDVLLEDVTPAAAKTGVVGLEGTVSVLAQAFKRFPDMPLVVDPVLRSGCGKELVSTGAKSRLLEELVSLSHVVTPNGEELKALTGHSFSDVDDCAQAAMGLVKLGARSVLVTGLLFGGKHEGKALDVLVTKEGYSVYSRELMKLKRVHGTGCVLSAAICAYIALGYDLREAVERARDVVWDAITCSVSPGLGVPCAYLKGGKYENRID